MTDAEKVATELVNKHCDALTTLGWADEIPEHIRSRMIVHWTEALATARREALEEVEAVITENVFWYDEPVVKEIRGKIRALLDTQEGE